MLTLKGCSLACAYAECDVSTCQCKCNGTMHGMSAPKKPELVAIKCSPAAEKRCKEGNKSGVCKCACGGINHGIYQHITDFESTVRITHYHA